MKFRKLKSKTEVEKHVCESYREGDWIIYSCSKCDYQLKENLATGETRVKNAKAHVRHSGMHIPAEYMSQMGEMSFDEMLNPKNIKKNQAN